MLKEISKWTRYQNVMKSTDVFTNSLNSLRMNFFKLNFLKKNSIELNFSRTESRTDLRSNLFERKIISIISQKIITTSKTSISVKSINSNIEMLNTFISLRQKMSQSSLVSLHFKSTLEQANNICKFKDDRKLFHQLMPTLVALACHWISERN